MRWITYALAAGLVAGLSGCGGGGETDTAGTVPPMGANAPVPLPSGSGDGGASASGGSGGAAMSGDRVASDPKSEEKYAALEAKLAKKAGDSELKTAVAEAAYQAGYYIEYDKPGLTPREKYRPALKLYNRALALNPKHELAAKEKTQIENIYTQMGMPIPK